MNEVRARGFLRASLERGAPVREGGGGGGACAHKEGFWRE